MATPASASPFGYLQPYGNRAKRAREYMSSIAPTLISALYDIAAQFVKQQAHFYGIHRCICCEVCTILPVVNIFPRACSCVGKMANNLDAVEESGDDQML